MIPCFLYARVSDKEKQGDGFSIEAQITVGREYAERHRLNVMQEFIDMQTAKEPGRKNFNILLDLIRQQKKPVALLVEKTDRLYRNPEDKIEVARLIRSGLEVHFFKEGEVLNKDSGSHKKLVHGFKALLAEFYINNLSEEVKKGRLQKARNGGFPGLAPFGYKNFNREIIPNEEQAGFVKAAYAIYGTGLYSLKSCIAKLFEEGYIYRPSMPRIPKTDLERLLKNRVYIGQIAFNGELFEGKHDQLVTMEEWEMVQKAFRKDSKPLTYNKHTFIYRGLLVCGECGKLLCGELKKQGRYTYYRCSGSANKTGCTQGYINEVEIDKQLTNVFQNIQVPDTLQQEILQGLEETELIRKRTLKEEKAKLQQAIDRAEAILSKAYDDRLSGIIDEDMWLKKSREYRDQIAYQKTRLQKIGDAEISYRELALTLFELPEILGRDWSSASIDKKIRLLNLAYSNLKIKDGKVEYELKELFSTLVNLPESEKKLGRRDTLITFLLLHSDTIKAAHQALVA